MRAHLLPKLRCHFAEFLRLGSLKRLGIFSPPTCVGLRYGRPRSWLHRGFSWKRTITELMDASVLLITSQDCHAVCGTRPPSVTPYRLEPVSNIRLGYVSPSPL